MQCKIFELSDLGVALCASPTNGLNVDILLFNICNYVTFTHTPSFCNDYDSILDNHE